MEYNPDFYSSEHTPEELEALDSVDKEFQFLNDNNKMMSSSDEKLSTPASQSRSGSLDRVPDRNAHLMDNSPRSSSRERSLDEMEHSSPGKSGSPLKTPDTDFSDSSAALPPPPPEVVFPPPPPPEELELELEPIQSPPSPSIKKQQLRQQVFPKGPVPMLRASLRKTKPNNVEAQNREKEDSGQLEFGDYRRSKTIGSLEESNVKQVISQYGTIPKGARIGAFLASLEQNNQESKRDSSGFVANLQSPSTDPPSSSEKLIHKDGSRSLQPTPEVTRKVEEWRRGVEVSMNPEQKAEEEEEHNVRPSSIFRSSSIHAMPGSEENNDATGPGGSLKRQKSDLSKSNKDDKTRRNSDNKLLLQNLGIKENMDAPIPEWKRQIQKPTASPRIGQRNLKQSRVEPKEQISQDQASGLKKEQFKSPPMLRPFQLKKPPASNEDVALDGKTDKNVNTDTVEYSSSQAVLRKFSPPVPKKPVTPQTSGDGRKDANVGGEMIKSTDSSQDDNADAVIDNVPLGKLNKSLWERDKREITDNKAREKVSKKEKKLEKKDRKDNKTASPSPIEKEKSKSKFSFLRGSAQPDTNSKVSAYTPTQEPAKTVPGKHLPPGAQPVLPGAGLPGARQVLPGGSLPVLPIQGSNVSSSTSSNQSALKATSVQLNKVEKTDKHDNTADGEPVSKDKLKTLSKNLSSSLSSLNLNKTKHTSNFMHLSEEVQSFYSACSSYVESLPPHGKFQFRELLTNLQAIAESLKTCSGGNAREYDKLLSKLQNSIRDINAVLARWFCGFEFEQHSMVSQLCWQDDSNVRNVSCFGRP